MRHATILIATILLATTGSAGAYSADPPKPDAPKAAPAAATAAASEEFKLPPGWAKKKRGKFVLYCKRDSAMGTRIKTETCYDEAGMRDYILYLAENKADVDRARSTCSNICVCGRPDACGGASQTLE